ncbi:MAG: XdhC/CoxI family protein [Dehalococcoidales bacterium]|nr:XdhC/CoxI family protein [Dehalococcoidales bacterium]MDD4322337.1 XdhC/CoxI family protein [Dehalococcoidales bacterium]MDD5122235.1 XdhC/CoxI family protein [Dehalococcoidales bacterium]MDD5498525.1 XdhC/CoxI family protein [Dehalococcoidales bacterium]
MEIDIYEEVAKVKSEGREAALVTLIGASGSTPRGEGAKMMVLEDGSTRGTIGGGSIEREVTQAALEVMRKGKPERYKYELKKADEGLGMICGGDVEVFIEPVLQSPSLFIFGAGHIAYTLSKMAQMAGYKVTIIDDRPGFATPERYPEAEKTLTTSFGSSFKELNISKWSFIVIVTYGHQADEVVLEEALKTPARYIGMIGSKSKNQAVYDSLKSRGVTEEQISRVYAPIGTRINAHTPEEIAVSILGQMIQVRRSS